MNAPHQRLRALVRGSLGGTAALLLALPASAMADKRITASYPNRFSPTDVTMDQGERLTFQNNDPTVAHNVFASLAGPDGKPLFATRARVGFREEDFVEGSQYLTTGNYQFVCTIHTDMVGTIHVTAAGQPKPRPGAGTPAGPDTTAPDVSVRLVSARQAAVRRSRELRVSVSVDEAATVALKATTRSGGRTITVGSGKVKLTAGGTRRQELTLTRAGRKALNGKRAVTVKLTARAVDKAGNVAKATRTKRLNP